MQHVWMGSEIEMVDGQFHHSRLHEGASKAQGYRAKRTAFSAKERERTKLEPAITAQPSQSEQLGAATLQPSKNLLTTAVRSIRSP